MLLISNTEMLIRLGKTCEIINIVKMRKLEYLERITT